MLREIENWLETGELEEQWEMLGKGLRFSPPAIKEMAYKVAAGTKITYKEAGFLEPHPDPRVSPDFSFQYKYEMAFYLSFVGFINEEQYRNFWYDTDGSKPNQDLGLGKYLPLIENGHNYLRNIVSPTIEKTAKYIQKIKLIRPNTVVVFNHGKWNGFPHSGYIMNYLNVMNILKKKGISEENVIYVVACDTNSDIRQRGSSPFLNTLWRISLNSYLPYDFVCSSGDFTSLEDADPFWKENYKILNPDYLVAVRTDRITKLKIKTLKELGLKTEVIQVPRYGSARENLSVSQTGLKTFNYDLLAALGFRMFIADAYNSGEFDRKANWKNFLATRGLL